MQMNPVVSKELIPVLMIWDRYVGKFPIFQNYTNGNYTESLLRHVLNANIDVKSVLVDESHLSLKIWYIPGAGKLLTNYNKNVPSPTLLQILEFLEKIKIFLIFFDIKHLNKEFLERVFQRLEKNYKNSQCILIAIKNDSQEFNDYKLIDELKSKYPHLKEFLPNMSTTTESLDEIFKHAGKLILEE